MKYKVKKPTAQQRERAARDFKSFHWGDEATREVEEGAPAVAPGDLLYELGELVEVVYETSKNGETFEWQHTFEHPRPRLAATKTGGLVVVGGSYSVNNRGIVG